MCADESAEFASYVPKHQVEPDALIERARSGSAAAFDQLIELLAEYLWADLSYRRKPRGLGPSHGWSDLVQDTLVRVREKFDRFERATFADFKQWARTILHRRRQEWARNYRARNREELRRKITLALTARRLAEPGCQDHVNLIERQQEANRAVAAFHGLKPHEQKIIRLRVEEELSFPQIEALTGLSAEGCRTAYRRAVAKLRKEFDADAQS